MIRGTGIDSTVKLYLKGNGANGSQKIFDDSQSHKSITVKGNAQISTTQSKFGGSSIYLDGSSSYLSAPDSSDWIFGSNNFSISSFVTPNKIGNRSGLVGQIINNDNRWELRIASSTGIQFYAMSGGSLVAHYNYAAGLTNNTQQYISLIKSGNTVSDVKLYIDGSLVTWDFASLPNSNIPDISAPLLVGVGRESNRLHYFNGYIDDLIIQKGVAIDGTKVPTRQRG